MHRLSELLSSVYHKIATARQVPATDLVLISLCWWMLAAASLMIALLPSRRILRTLGPNLGGVLRLPANDSRQHRHAQRIARAIGIAGRNAPFRSDCYPQALVAAQLCRWFGVPHAVQLGARFAATDSVRAGGLEAHAWVRSGALTLCGGRASAQHFATVACFVHMPRSGRGNAVG